MNSHQLNGLSLILLATIISCESDDKVGTDTDTEVVSDTDTDTDTDADVDGAPIAVDDTTQVWEEDQVRIPVGANDVPGDNDIDFATVTIIGQPVNGSATSNGDGSVDYVHDGSETVEDSFTYTVAGVNGLTSNQATVDVEVGPVNDPPVAIDDVGAIVDEGQMVNIDLAVNDTDADDGIDLAGIIVRTAPLYGAVYVNLDGTVDYSHDGSELPTDSFTYSIDDLTGDPSNEATVDIGITLSDDSPIAVDDFVSHVDGALSNVNVTGNDVDPEGFLDLTSIVILAAPIHGTATALADGTVDYQHDGLGVLDDTFTYTVDDQSGLTSNIATVTMQDGPPPCDQHPQWMPVTCTTPDWVWSRDRTVAQTVPNAELNGVLATGCYHAGAMQPDAGDGMCSLTGGGWVSIVQFQMTNCDTEWYHLGGAFSGNCGGHDTAPPADLYRHLVMDINGCYDY